MNQSLLQAAIARNGAEAVYGAMTEEQRANVKFNWKINARPQQLAPTEPWQYWLLLAGRGFGKTRSGAEWVRDQVWTYGRRRIAFVAPTAADARDVMIEGESGILNIGPDHEKPKYEPSKRRLTWPNGAVASIFSSEKPDRLRGPQFEAAWAEELCSWYNPPASAADADPLDMLLFGLRLGKNPQLCVTTTPRPTKHIKMLLKDPSCVVTKGSTYDNRANLADQFFNKIISKYEGTRLGRQEIHAELLEDNPDAIFFMEDIEKGRLQVRPSRVTAVRTVTAIDPAAKSHDRADDTGIMTGFKGDDGHYYILEDSTCHEKPDGWARKAIDAYKTHCGDRIVGEVNNGGEMIEAVLRTVDKEIPYKSVHATRGKAIRAEPVAALYEQGKIHHVGILPKLEAEMCEWSPIEDRFSPNRMDALVWLVTELSGGFGGITMQKLSGT